MKHKGLELRSNGIAGVPTVLYINIPFLALDAELEYRNASCPSVDVTPVSTFEALGFGARAGVDDLSKEAPRLCPSTTFPVRLADGVRKKRCGSTNRYIRGK